jgi:hypothetical protein
MLIVTNNNTFDLNDRYNGIDFSFPVGQRVAIDEVAARHIFGFGDADKTPYLVRQGWMRSTGEFESAMKALNGFSFESLASFQSGEFIQNDQGTAPLESETSDAATSAASGESTPDVVVPVTNGKKSILDKLVGA